MNKLIEIEPGHWERPAAPEPTIEPKPAQIAPETATRPVPELPTYTPQTWGHKMIQWVNDAPTRRFDQWNGTDLYGELQAKRKREQLFLKAASLGLLDTGHDSYKRQLKALSKRQGL